MPSSKGWRTAARFGVSLTLLWIVSRFVDLTDVLARLSDLEPGWVALGLGLSVLQVATLAWRWRYTAARLGIELPFRVALGEYYLGILLNQVLPGGVMGDVTRAWRHARTDAPPGPAVRAVILERASAQVVMTMAAVAAMLWLPWAAPSVRVAAVAVAAALALALAWLTGRTTGDSMVARFLADARASLLARGAWPIQLASAILVAGSYVAVFVIAARAVGATVPATTILPLVPPVLMTMLVPVTVAGWGIREGAAAALWGLVGLTPEDGAAISVAYGLLVLASVAPGVIVLVAAPSAGRDRRERPPPA